MYFCFVWDIQYADEVIEEEKLVLIFHRFGYEIKDIELFTTGRLADCG